MDIDITRHLGMVRREAGVREHEGRPMRVVVASRTYDSDIEDVWDALTNPERIPRWFMPIEGELRVGGRFSLKGNASGEIQRCEQPKHLTVTWEMHGDTSWVKVELSKAESAGEDDATTLRLEHMAPVPDDFWEQYGPGAVGIGWELGLMGLAEHLAGMPAVDHEVAEKWPTTDDGRKYVEHSSEGWCAASIAGGTPEASAKAGAARVTAFYTGQQETAPPTD